MPEINHFPAQLDLKLIRGDTFYFDIKFGINITGYTFESSVIVDSDTSIDFTILVTDVNLGIIRLTLTSADTADIPSLSVLDWYFRWSTPSPQSETRTLIKGKVYNKEV